MTNQSTNLKAAEAVEEEARKAEFNIRGPYFQAAVKRELLLQEIREKVEKQDVVIDLCHRFILFDGKSEISKDDLLEQLTAVRTLDRSLTQKDLI